MDDSTQFTLLQASIELSRHKLSIVPAIGKVPFTGDDGWGKYQQERATTKQLQDWFDNPDVTGFGVIGGPISGGLAIRDYDGEAGRRSYERWRRDHPDLSSTLPTVQTPGNGGGLHVLARCPGAPSRKLEDGELRAAGNFTILPNSRHPGGGRYRWLHPLHDEIPTVNLADFCPSLHSIVNTCNGLPESGWGELGESVALDETEIAGRVEAAITRTLPSKYGHRNRQCFELARRLKGIPGLPHDDLEEIVVEWHKQALPTIRTKDFETTWGDFRIAWTRVKRPAGAFLDELMAALNSSLPADASDLERLSALCRELQRHAGDSPFHLSVRTVAKFLGLSVPTAWDRLRFLEFPGGLVEVKKGTKEGRLASEYRWIGGTS